MDNSKKAWAALTLPLATLGCGGGSVASTATGSGEVVAIVPTPTPSPSPTTTPPPVAATPAGYILAKSLDGAEDLSASFDIGLGLQAAWGTGQIPGNYEADEGAFRFICGGDGKLAKDDPVVYFNQPGASHLHQVWGNSLFDARTTPSDLAKNAVTNCNDTAYSLNRSSYWMPALVHESGEVLKPDLVMVYYKRKISSSAYCTPGNPKFAGTCVGIPSQIRFIFGWDSKNPTAPVKGASWYCTTAHGHHANLDDAFNAGCTAGADLIADTGAPNCWDGKHLDTPDHRSHMSYIVTDPHTAIGRCPSTHPYLIPQQQNKAQFRVTEDMYGTRPDGTKYSRVRLSSDGMLPGAKAGATLHADYMEAWVTAAKKLWVDNCIEKALNCSGGDLGNGKQLIGAAQPAYGWRNPNARVSWSPPG
ncbi:DUF1996 domain-containing protein [Qipengyuania sediminis]|uniref:DUF1996 domain-containing protein n=1 Tax=Qipengyuania sediminis TaxID=1532023 RepID=UPI001059810F|nr:DUF1996 domain-containing protein [Qipengyuania sediminis]